MTTDLQAHFKLQGTAGSSSDTSAPCDWATVNTNTCTDSALFDTTGVIHDEFVNGKDQSAFTTGSSDVNDIPTWGCTQKPFDAKNDILHTYAAAYLVPVAADAANPTHRIVYMGQERQKNNGDAFAGFWLLHGPASCGTNGVAPTSGNASWVGNHTPGDLLIVSNYTNGGGTNAVEIFVWTSTGLDQTATFISQATCTLPTDMHVACSIPNTTAFMPSWGSQTLDTNEFVESGVDLTAVDEMLGNANPPIAGLTGISSCFTNFMSETRSSQSATAELHDYASGQTNTCPTPNLPTDDTSFTHSGTVGTAMSIGDTVSLTGGANPTGHVDFTLYSDSACTVPASPAVASGDITLSGGAASYGPVSWTPSATGTYYWKVTYSGDSNNGANSACGGAKETLSVGKASPTITTQAVPTTGTVGVSISVVGDTATFHNTASVAPPTGSVTFTLYNSDCSASTGVSGSGSITTTSGTSSATFTTSWTPQNAGTYQWKASYAGDSNNNGFTTACGDAHEQLVIGAVSPTLTTQASPTSGTSGVAISNLGDTATFHGNTVAPTGSVSFTLYSDAACTSAVSGVSGSGNITTNSGTSTATYTKATWTPPAAGTYYWKASYAGDNNNNAFTTSCGDANEEVVIGKASPTITTQASPTTGTSGVSIADVGDTATFHNTTTTPPTGSVSFTLYSDSNCTTAVSGVSGSGSISGGSATYTAHNVTLAAGTYYWKAHYDGDANNNSFTTGCGDANEELVIGKASPTITTNASPTTGSIGIPMTVGDSATFHSTTSIPPTGDVTFTLYAHNTDGCFGPVAGVSGSGPIGTVGGVSTASYSTSWTPTATGTYYWVASYPGDANNNGYTTGCGDANEEVTILAPSLALTKVADHTTSVPAGTPIGFTITLTNHGAGTAAGVLLSDTLPAVPTNSGALWQEAAAPTLTGSDLSGVTCSLSTGSPQVFSCGSGAGFLMAPGDSISVHVTHATDALSATSGSPAGKYPNTVSVTSTNTSVPSASATEFVEALSTTPSASSAVQTPASVSDTATLAGGNAPTGTITFQLYGPGDTKCATNLVAGNGAFTVALDSTGHATSPNYTATAAGTYQWVAIYSGDANNAPLSGACGDATEQFTTFAAAVQPLAKTGDISIFMVLGIPFIVTGLILFGLSWRRREEQA